MKQFVLIPLLLMTFFFASSFNASAATPPTELRVAPSLVLHLTSEITLSGGCTIRYDFYINLDILPLRLRGITGTMTFSGNCTGPQTINSTRLRGVTDPATNELSQFGFTETVINDPKLQKEFEKYLEKEINARKNEASSIEAP